MGFILQLLVNAAVLLILGRIMPTVKMRSYGTAIGVALVIGILNATIGFVIRLPLNVLTLGLLTFLVRLFVDVIVIKMTDKLFSGFEVHGFWSALIIAVILALVGTIISF